MSWAIGNRSALIRLPGRGPGDPGDPRRRRRHEPLPASRGLLASIADGVEQQLLPPPPRPGSTSGTSLTPTPRLAGSRGSPAICRPALDALEADEVLSAALGPVIARHYVDVKRFEWAAYLERAGLPADSTNVSEWERRTYFGCL